MARSKARRRVRCAALKGIPAACRDLYLLEAHHSAPIYTSVIRPSAMGWDKQKDKQRAKPGSGYWDYWRGTQQQWGKDKQQDHHQQAKQVLVPYDKVKVEVKDGQATDRGVGQQMAGHTGQEDLLLKHMQTCVNQARKAENKVKRLQADHQHRVLQWKQYEQDVRSAFMAERARHQRDLEQLGGELEQALQQQEAARMKVRLAAQGPTTEVLAMEVQSEDEMDPWFELTKGDVEEKPQDDATLRAVLARAMTGPHASASTQSVDSMSAGLPRTPQTHRAAPRSPTPMPVPAQINALGSGMPMAGSRLTPFPPPKRARMGELGVADQMQVDAYAAVDPYQQPVMGQEVLGVPGITSPPLGRPKTPKLPAPPVGSKLQEKLELKRTQNAESHSSPPLQPPSAAQGPMQFILHDDDADEQADQAGAGSQDMD